MEYYVLWITSLIMTLLYCGLGGTIFFKYHRLLDAFQRAAIICFGIALFARTSFWIVAWQYDKYNQSILRNPDELAMPIRTTLGASISAISFIIYQIIILRIIVEFDQLRYQSTQIKAIKARNIKRLMYGFIVLYLLLTCAKIFYDIQNGLKLEQYYRTPCQINGKIDPSKPKYCEADDLSNIADDENQRKVPQIVFGSFKIIFDLSIVGVGAYFFFKLCSFNPQYPELTEIDDSKIQKQKLLLYEHMKQQMEASLLKNSIFQGIVYLCFLVILIRVIIKDIILSLLDFDFYYLSYCRCQVYVDRFYMYQALVFDVFDFTLALVITLYIFRVAYQADRLAAEERSHHDSSMFQQDPLHPNNAVNDLMSHLGGGANASHDEADLSIISSQYNNRQTGNSNNRFNEINFPTQPEINDNNSIIGVAKQHSTKRLQGPVKLTQSFKKEQIEHNQRKHASQLQAINFTDHRVSISPEQHSTGNQGVQGQRANQLMFTDMSIAGGAPRGNPDSHEEENADLVSSNNSILDYERQETQDALAYQHQGSFDNPNLPKSFLNIKYKK